MKIEEEKIIELKKEVLNIIENRKEQLISNGIKIEIVVDTELEYFTIFWGKEYVVQIIIGNPCFAPYKFICFEIIEISSEKIVYYWYDDDKTKIQDVIKNINDSINYFISL